jgi:hypothetical protein
MLLYAVARLRLAREKSAKVSLGSRLGVL